jgi:aminopeptidase N
LGDMYSKGALMLHTLRNLIANDVAWFDLLRGIQTHFAYQTITTQDIVKYINEKTKTDYTDFFEQYLTKAPIPKLQLAFKKEGGAIQIKYRWRADVEKFNMPVKVTTSRDIFAFIYPTKEWKVLDLKNMKEKDFKVATDLFYVGVIR